MLPPWHRPGEVKLVFRRGIGQAKLSCCYLRGIGQARMGRCYLRGIGIGRQGWAEVIAVVSTRRG
jgi:hypothetical protein